MLLLIAINSVFTWLAFQNPAVVHGIQEQQTAQIRRSLAGQPGMTEERIEQAEEEARKISPPHLMAVLGTVGAAVGVTAFLFFQGFVLWLVDRIVLGSGAGFMRFVEISGVAHAISMLSAVARMFIVRTTGELQSGTSLALLMEEFDEANPLHLVLNNVEFFFVWYLAVVALGIRIVTRTPLVKAVAAVTIFWILLTGLLVLPALLVR